MLPPMDISHTIFSCFFLLELEVTCQVSFTSLHFCLVSTEPQVFILVFFAFLLSFSSRFQVGLGTILLLCTMLRTTPVLLGQ